MISEATNLKALAFSLIPGKRALGKFLVAKYLEHPIFVVGSGRSGTTALAAALDQHPSIHFSHNEAALSLAISELAANYCHAKNSAWQQANILLKQDEFRQALKELLFNSVWGAHFGLRANLGIFKGSISRLRSTQYWGTKAFATEHGYLGLQWMFPNAKYIYIVRNGINVIASMRKFGEFSNKSFRECCEFWVTTVERYEYLRQTDTAITVRFEDFLNNREEVLTSIQTQFGISISAAPARFAASTLVHPLGDKTTKTDPKEAIGARPPAWQSWPQEERMIFTSVCEDAMNKLGYEIPF